MSTNKRPWYKWWPKDFRTDEKVQCLSPLSELIYRRLLDVMWQSDSVRIPNGVRKLYAASGHGLQFEEFEVCWDEIQYQDFELFKISKDKKWIYSARLLKEKEAVESRSTAAIKANTARWKNKKTANPNGVQTDKKRSPKRIRNTSHTDTDTDTDIKEKEYKEKEYKEKEVYDFYKTEINPSRKSSTRAKQNIKHFLKKYSKKDLIESIKNYKIICGEEPEYKKDPANFFGKQEQYFIDYLPDIFENPKKLSKEEKAAYDYDYDFETRYGGNN